MQIPTFDPDREDISAKAWLNLVDLGQQAAGKTAAGADVWSDEITASHAILLLRGKAASWISNLIEEKDDSLKKWSDLKKKFRGRFCEKHSLSQKTKLISDLNQSPHESCQDFYDRCRCQLHVLYDEEWDDVAGPGAAADAEARSKSIKMHHKVLFASGLRPDIKQDVIMQDMKSLDDLKAVAMRVEASVKETNKAQKPKVADVNWWRFRKNLSIRISDEMLKKMSKLMQFNVSKVNVDLVMVVEVAVEVNPAIMHQVVSTENVIIARNKDIKLSNVFLESMMRNKEFSEENNKNKIEKPLLLTPRLLPTPWISVSC